MRSIILRVILLSIIITIISIFSSTSFALSQSSPLNPDNISILNNVKVSDLVKVTGLLTSDVVNVYDLSGKLLKKASVPQKKTEISISISQIGKNAGSLYISVTRKGQSQSEKIEVGFLGETKADTLSTENIVITNNVGKQDTIKITGISLGDTVRAYDAIEGGKLLGAATATKSAEAVINIKQLGYASGSVYISIMCKGKNESDRVEMNFSAEEKSTSLVLENIAIVNNVSKTDTINVNNLLVGEIIKVYSDEVGLKTIGASTVAKNKNNVSINIAQLGADAGSVFITLTSSGKTESERVKVDFPQEPKTEELDPECIVITNNAGSADTIKLTELYPYDLIKVYDQPSSGKLLGSASVSGTGSEATISIPQIGSDAGSVYISVTEKGFRESERIKVDFSEETKSRVLDSKNISIANNSGMSDVINVIDLEDFDIIKVYNITTNGTLLGSGTVPSNIGEITINIPQIGSQAGSVYVTLTNIGKQESERIKIDFLAELKSDAPEAKNISITNYASMSDVIKVINLDYEDIVKIYNATTKGTILGSATVAMDIGEVTINIPQIGTAAGTVYVTVTSKNKQESERVNVDFQAETQTLAPNLGNIVIQNNAGMSDCITVKDLDSFDTVKIYNAATRGTLLGTSTVPTDTDEITLNIPQIGTGDGSVYVSITNKGKLESERTKMDFSAEPITIAPDPLKIEITNNAGLQDTVKVTELNSGDIVKVYSAAIRGILLATSSVAINADSLTVNVLQIGSGEGSIYVTATSKGKQESERTKVDFIAEPKSTPLAIELITIENNAGIADTVSVADINSYDVVKVYNSTTKGTLLGTATVSADETETTVSISQIGTSQGSVYVSVARRGKLESERIKADFTQEKISVFSDSNSFIITNNAGMSDTIKAMGLTSQDVVKVYDTTSKGSLLGSGTVATNNTELTISIVQLGTSEGSVYISVTKKGRYESERNKVDFAAEALSLEPQICNVIITNNAGLSDTVRVMGITSGDAIKVYNDDTTPILLGSATVSNDSSEVNISIKQLGVQAGNVNVTCISKGKLESNKVKIGYADEPISEAPVANNVYISNNVSTADTIKVTFLDKGDVVKIYTATSGGNSLGSATASSINADVTISVNQLGTSTGSIYVTLTKTGKLESNRTKVYFAAEPKSDAPLASDIYITNNAGMADSIKVTFLEPQELVTVYDLNGNILGTATSTIDNTKVIINLSQIGANAGNVYVSVTSKGKLESDKTKAYFAAEMKSDSPLCDNIYITNNAGIFDSIRVTFLEEDDLVNIYDSSEGGNLLGSATVSDASNEAMIAVKQLGTGCGNVYISITSWGKQESTRTNVAFLAEATSDSPVISNISIVNNAGKSDVVKVAGLTSDDIVRVYNSVLEGNLLGISTVSANSTETNININQLGTDAGSVYISVTSIGKLESVRIKASYFEEK